MLIISTLPPGKVLHLNYLSVTGTSQMQAAFTLCGQNVKNVDRYVLAGEETLLQQKDIKSWHVC